MVPISKYPLYALSDKLARAFALHGFSVTDGEPVPEMVPATRNFAPLEGVAEPDPVLLMDGSYVLRTSLLPGVLSSWKGALPLRNACIGRTYQAADGIYPEHAFVEAVWANHDLPKADLQKVFSQIAKEVFGISATLELEAADNGGFTLNVVRDEEKFELGLLAPAAWLTKAILGTDAPDVKTYVIRIDVDAVAMHEYALADRAALYSVDIDYLASNECACPSYGDSYQAKARNILRSKGFLEFVGQRVYAEDCYIKMNMIQEAWDTNNAGVQLKTPVEDRTQLPTVLAPSLEEALAENFKKGHESVKIFEIGQIYKPPVGGADPMDILSISFGAYGPDMDKTKFRSIVDSFLSELGIANHFFFPTTMAIAYDITDCWLILDEHPAYLGGNFGGISPVARKNHGIEVPAWMCQLELPLLAQKADSEYGFIPNELQ